MTVVDIVELWCSGDVVLVEVVEVWCCGAVVPWRLRTL